MNFIEALLVLTGGLCVTLIGVLVVRNEKTGSLKGEIGALKAQNAELRAQLKKEAEQANVLLNHLREYYDQCVERNEQEVEEAGAAVHFYEKQLDGIIQKMKESAASTAAFLKSMEDDPYARVVLRKADDKQQPSRTSPK